MIQRHSTWLNWKKKKKGKEGESLYSTFRNQIYVYIWTNPCNFIVFFSKETKGKKKKEKGSKIINFSVPAWYLHRALDPSSGNEGRVMD